MGKQLKINAGSAVLLKTPPESYSEYDSIHINTGSALISRKVYDKLMKLGVSINSGSTNIIDVESEVAELPDGTIITAESSYNGCFLICEGNIIIEDEKGLEGITGLYADCVFHPQSVNLDSVKRIISPNRITYANGSKLYLDDMTLSGDSHITLDHDTSYWVHGKINALEGDALEKIRQKSISFHCKHLTTYSSLYEEYGGMFQTDNIRLIPDGYGVVWGATLDGGTSFLHGGKLYVIGDMMIQHDQAKHLSGFSSIIVEGALTMPVSAAPSFKAVGKAKSYDLYEGVLREGNGKTTINHDMLQSAINQGISYTFRVNGKLIFTEDVTVQDIDAISAIECNGAIIISGTARGALDSKIKSVNGAVGSMDELDKDIRSLIGEEKNVNMINTGCLRF